MKSLDLVKILFSFLVTFLIIDFSPFLLTKIQPDSTDYLNFHPKRQTTYYILIQVLEFLKIDLIFFQKLFLSISITALFYLIKKKTNIFFSISAYLIIISNVYYTSFSKTILTEAFFFSFINLAIFFVFDLKKKFNLISFALCCGMISALKPIGVPVALILIIIGLIQIKKINQFFLISIFFLIPNIVENVFFYSNFSKRETVFKHSVAGKLFILSGKDSFEINNYPENLRELLLASKTEFKTVHQYLAKIDNIFLRSELLSDYEVVAQYQTFNFESVKKINFDRQIIFDNSLIIFFQVMKNNLSDYLKLSFSHYLGSWSIGAKVRFLEKNNNEIPKYEELKLSSGQMNLPALKLIELSQYFFLILLFILTFYSLIFCLSLLGLVKTKLDFQIFSIIFLIQSYLILICLTNVSTPRYLMPVYTILIVLLIDFLSQIQKIIKKY